MGYTSYGNGILTGPDGADDAGILTALHTAFGTDSFSADADVVLTLLACVEANEGLRHDDGTFDVSYVGWNPDIVDRLDTLAGLGFTGSIEWDGEDLTRWKVLLEHGRATQMDAQMFYPTDPDPTVPTVLLTREDARAVLALVAGDHAPGLDAAVARLTAALS